jgi:hypothetical protein
MGKVYQTFLSLRSKSVATLQTASGSVFERHSLLYAEQLDAGPISPIPFRFANLDDYGLPIFVASRLFRGRSKR